MRLAIISDTHLGFGWGTRRQEDSFTQAEEALNKALQTSDAILLPGDVFDSRVPRQEVMEKAMRVLSLPLQAKSSGVKVNAGKHVPEYTVSGVPVIAIHGTHERRARDLANPVQTLEAAGLLIRLHCGKAMLEKDGEQVVVFGMSGVPESYAPKVLREWNPAPDAGAKNVLMLHQNIKGYVYEEAAFISPADLPKDFDLIVNGHIHKRSIDKNLLHCGSTITTQITREEAREPKGFYVYDTRHGLEFHELETQRTKYYEVMEFNNATAQEVRERARTFLENISAEKHAREPLVKLKLSGTLRTGESLNKAEITKGFGSIIISLDDSLSTAEFRKRIKDLKDQQKNRQSIEELGMKLLNENLKQADYTGMPAEELFTILENGDIDAAITTIYRQSKSGKPGNE
ncbi:MAG: DNA repair exonuclease [Candidatus Diapherotrites archaeon]|nr:DNA repair exonuclease [Candidatus Diapherotrites archaeon]